MATVATKPITAEEFYEWLSRPENYGRFFELERGEIIPVPPPGKYHGFVCGNVARILGNYAVARRQGYVCTNDAGVIVERDPDTVRGPDVTFYDDAQDSLSMERRFAVKPPLLAVEVLSPHDRLNKTMQRIAQMLHRGVTCVWVIDPEARDLTVHRAGQEPLLMDATLELDGGDLLIGFRCRVAELFSLPGA